MGRGIFERRVKFEIKLISCNRINCGKWECVAAVVPYAALAFAMDFISESSMLEGFLAISPTTGDATDSKPSSIDDSSLVHRFLKEQLFFQT